MFLGPSNDSSIMDMPDYNNTVRIMTWGQPSNHEDFMLKNYTVTLRNSSGDIAYLLTLNQYVMMSYKLELIVLISLL